MAEGTLHERIVTELRERITSGVWPSGHRIPFETEMAADFGVSRMTMNKALAQLTREGFLERRRKLGTVVTAPRMQSAVMEIANIGEEIRALGQDYGYRLLSRNLRPAGPEDRQFLRPADEAPFRVLTLEALHLADGLPFCHESRVIHLGAVPQAEAADFAAQPSGAWLLQQVPWSAAEHVIRSTGASPDIAQALHLRPGTPCLEIARRTEFEGRPVTFARLTYPGERHQLVAGFAPG
ncbi:UTRA domain-containing protein [Neotabrizicola sp. sgz301269]|uniref:UTRA domain-containing protein n=1 Tax=Neotabrizicola sp. sgz301269 TaxID=3276282 RepID=UPI00376FF0B9